MEDDAEELARNKLKAIIKMLKIMKENIEKDGRRTRDYKKVLIGQKYTTEEALEQLDTVLT